MRIAEHTWKKMGSLVTHDLVLLTSGLFERTEMSFHLA